jgi:hypothetical protein
MSQAKTNPYPHPPPAIYPLSLHNLLPTQPVVVAAILGPYPWTFQLPHAAYHPKNTNKGLIIAAGYTVVASSTWHMIV